MIALPQRVKTAFLKLKRANSKYIEIKHINNYFFVYQSTSRWDREKKRPIKIPTYIGRITNAGIFVPIKRRKIRSNVQQANLQTVQETLDTKQKTLETAIKDERKYKHEPTLLTALSMNGRIPMSVLGKMVGIKETAVSTQVKKLVAKYGIKYIAEIDVTKFGYTRFLISVKFIDQIPNVSELKGIFSQEPHIQLVLLTKGDVDLIIHALAESGEKVTALIYRLRTKIGYRAIWNTAPVFEDYGHILLREEFIDSISNKMLKREYAVLKELIKNGNVEFSEIDKLYNFDKGRSQYSYHKLRENGVIKRITISMQTLPIKYIAIIFGDVIDFKLFSDNRDKIFKDMISDSTTQINRYIAVDDTTSPAGLVLYLPIFKDGDLEATVENLSQVNLGINIRTNVVTSILVGNFCYRNFDNAYSIQHEVLVKTYKFKQLPKINYEETGRSKRERIKYTSDIRGLTRFRQI